MGAPALPTGEKTSDLSAPETVSLRGQWSFRTDSGNVGKEQCWYGTDESIGAWHKVRVPHTWQIDSAFIDYRGVAWYRRTFDVPSEWQNSAVRIEFEAVFHTATIWVNGRSEERRVGKECRYRWAAHRYKRKTPNAARRILN